MATPRTATGLWKRRRAQVLATAKEQGLTRCPLCGVHLDWAHSLRPNSPEVDHIVPHSKGGSDEIENCQTICRKCNQSLGGKAGNPKGRQRPRSIDYRPAGDW